MQVVERREVLFDNHRAVRLKSTNPDEVSAPKYRQGAAGAAPGRKSSRNQTAFISIRQWDRRKLALFLLGRTICCAMIRTAL